MNQVFFIKIAQLSIISQELVTACTAALSLHTYTIQNVHSSWVFTTEINTEGKLPLVLEIRQDSFVQLLPKHFIC